MTKPAKQHLAVQLGLLTLVGSIAAAVGYLVHQSTVSPGTGASDTRLGNAGDRTSGGAQAPSIARLWAAEFKSLTGEPVQFARFRGKPLVINFWASWCGPCLEEMPDFQRASSTEQGKRMHFIGIGIDYAKNMQPFADKLGITYTLLESGAQGLDILKAAGNASGALPFTLIVDAQGNVRAQKLGKMDYTELMAAIAGQ